MQIDFHQAIITQIIDNSGYAFSLLEYFVDDIIGKKIIGSAGGSEMMGDIGFGFTAIQAGEVIFEIDTLIECFHGIKLDGFVEVGLGGQDEVEWSLGVDFKVGEESEFFEDFGG